MSEEGQQYLPPSNLPTSHAPHVQSSSTGTSNAQQGSSSGATVGSVIQQVISSVTPELLRASKAVATEIARQTQAEMKAWQELQDDRRKRDATTFQFEGNREQFTHASNVLAEFENTEVHLRNKEWEKAQEAINRGKTLLHERFNLIKMADKTNWHTVKEFKTESLNLDDADAKKWQSAVKNFKGRDYSKSERSRRSPEYYSPDRHSWRENSRRSSKPYPKGVTCYKCGQLRHFSYTCWGKK